MTQSMQYIVVTETGKCGPCDRGPCAQLKIGGFLIKEEGENVSSSSLHWFRSLLSPSNLPWTEQARAILLKCKSIHSVDRFGK